MGNTRWGSGESPVRRCSDFRASLVFLPIRISTVDPERDPATGKPVFRILEEKRFNLSRGGACIRSWDLLAEGTRLALSLQLTPSELSGRALEFEGRVVWTQRSVVPNASGGFAPPAYGIEFVEGSRFEFAAPDNYLRSIGPRPTSALPETLPRALPGRALAAA